MDPTLRNYMGPLLNGVPAELIDQEAKEKLLALGALLPRRLDRSLFCFECELDREKADVDFAFSIGRNSSAHKSLADMDPDHGAFARIRNAGAWTRIGEFCSLWSRGNSLPRSLISQAYFEYDLNTMGSAHPVPSVFLGMKPASSKEGKGERRKADHTERLKAILASIEILKGKAPGEPLQSTLGSCFAHLPGHAGILGVGIMLSRSTESVRVSVGNVSLDESCAYLDALDWCGSTEPLQRDLSDPSILLDGMNLTIDVGNGIGQRLGLECYSRTRQQSVRSPRWEKLVERLVEKGLCVPQKAKAAMQFPGLCPIMLATRDDRGIRLMPALLARGYHHVKYVFDKNMEMQVKLYLWCKFIGNEFTSP